MIRFVMNTVLKKMISTETILFWLISLVFEERGGCHIHLSVDWKCLWKMASQQGVSAICLDGLQILDKGIGCLTMIPKPLKMQWIVSVVK